MLEGDVPKERRKIFLDVLDVTCRRKASKEPMLIFNKETIK